MSHDEARKPCAQCGKPRTAADDKKGRPGHKPLCGNCFSAVDRFCNSRTRYDSRYDRLPTRPGVPCRPPGWSNELLRGWQDLHPDTRLSGYEESFEDDELS